jgi:tripartite ATP-independent transporter DctM subunit
MTTIAVIGIIVMIVLILMGVNVSMALFIVGFFGFAAVVNFNAAFGMLRTVPFSQALTYSFVVIPLFILMGQFAFLSGMSTSLYSAAERWLSSVRGGLALATIAACAAFSAICGSSGATAATMGVVAYPEMKRFGYAPSLSSGSIAAGGTLGVLIPPSTMFIIYGIISGESIGRLFAAGVIPGLILMLCYMAAIVVLMRVKPEYAPDRKTYSWKERFVSLKGCIGFVVLFICVLGSIFTGIASATEAAAFGAFLALVLMIVNGQFTLKKFYQALIETLKTTAMMLLIILGAMVFGYFLSATRLPQLLNTMILDMHTSKYVVIFVIFLIYLVLGCIMDAVAMILITVPIFLPIVVSLGFSPIWFGVFCVLMQEVSMMTPPLGMNVFITKGILKEVSLETVYKGVTPFVIGAVICVFIICALPTLSLWLPGILY